MDRKRPDPERGRLPKGASCYGGIGLLHDMCCTGTGFAPLDIVWRLTHTGTPKCGLVADKSPRQLTSGLRVVGGKEAAKLPPIQILTDSQPATPHSTSTRPAERSPASESCLAQRANPRRIHGRAWRAVSPGPDQLTRVATNALPKPGVCCVGNTRARARFEVEIMQVLLRKIYGIGAEGELAVTAPDCSIGRSYDCNLRLACPTVSRRHCELVIRDRAVAVRDLNSKNGTFVNGQRVVGEWPLLPGDKLEIGMCIWQIEIDSQSGSDIRTFLSVGDHDSRGPRASAEALLLHGRV